MVLSNFAPDVRDRDNGWMTQPVVACSTNPRAEYAHKNRWTANHNNPNAVGKPPRSRRGVRHSFQSAVIPSSTSSSTTRRTARWSVGQVIVTGRRGGGRGIEMVAHIVGVRMPIPSAFPGVLRVDLSVVNRDVVISVPADSQGCIVDGRRVLGRGKDDLEFQLAACIRDGRSGDLPRRSEPRLVELEDRPIE
jgi:hypothetical protein